MAILTPAGAGVAEVLAVDVGVGVALGVAVGAAVGVGEGFARRLSVTRRTTSPAVLELVETLAFAEVTATALL